MSYKSSLYKNINVQSLPVLFINPQALPFHLKILAYVVKDQDTGNKTSWRKHVFSLWLWDVNVLLVFYRDQVWSLWVKMQTSGRSIFFEKEKKSYWKLSEWQIFKVFPTIISEKSKPSKQVNLTYSICQKHTLIPTLLLQTSKFYTYRICCMAKFLK